MKTGWNMKINILAFYNTSVNILHKCNSINVMIVLPECGVTLSSKQ